MKKTTVLKGQDGFTLVELMVVVAIIGLLSAVAIPNFKKYQAKARTAEAKLQLSAIYTAQASFFSDFNIYHWCLNYMGYNPSAEAASRYYTTGFVDTAVTLDTTALSNAEIAGLNQTACGAKAAGNSYFQAGRRITSAAPLLADTALAGANVGTQASGALTYVAGAIGHISSDTIATTASTAASYFRIDQNKKIENVQAGY